MAWTESDIKKIWYKVITDLRLRFPDWMDLMKQEGYRAIVVNKKANYFGRCDYRDKTVSVNIYLHRCSQESAIVDTMLHEIAHAVDYCLHGKSSGHGKPWQDIASELGCTPKATSKTAVKVEFPYLMAVHDKEERKLYIAKGYNRKPARTKINTFFKDVWLKGYKDITDGKVIVYDWKTWCSWCDQYGQDYHVRWRDRENV